MKGEDMEMICEIILSIAAFVTIAVVTMIVRNRGITKRIKYLKARKELRWCRKQERTDAIMIKELILETVLRHKRTRLKCRLIQVSATVCILFLSYWLYKYGFQVECALIIALMYILLRYAERDIETSEKKLADPYVCMLELHKDKRELIVKSALETINKKQSINLDKLMVAAIIQKSYVQDKYSMFKDRKGYVWIQKEIWWFGNLPMGTPFEIKDGGATGMRIEFALNDDANRR